MTYVMSDIHGCYDKYMNMLSKINFSCDDTLYILGDVVDRGNGGMKVILDAAARENVITLKGNHDHEAYVFLKNLTMPIDDPRACEFASVFRVWLSDGGIPTYESFIKLCDSEKETVLSYLNSLPIFEEIVICGRFPKGKKCLILTAAEFPISLSASRNMTKHILRTPS